MNTAALLPLPEQPPDAPWPVLEWPQGPIPDGVDLTGFLDEAFQADGPMRTTYAVVIAYRGRVIAERYGGEIEHFDRAPEPVTSETKLLSWSMGKSVLHALVGILVGEGRLGLDDPVAVPMWAAPGDPRGAITLEHLLEMRDGLAFVEDYVDEQVSDVIEMLFGGGQADMARFAADRPLATAPGERFNYSSGTSNIVSAQVARVVGSGELYRRFLAERLLSPIGVATFDARFDEVGTWIGSSFLYLTARDFARFGLLYLRDGVFADQRILPEGWIDHGRLERSIDPDGKRYGAHWWITGDPYGTFYASGYAGQRIDICPALDLVVVRLGDTPKERHPVLDDWRRRLIESLAEVTLDQAPS